MKKYTKKAYCVMISVLLMLFMCSCQNNPQNAVVSSKNDGSFDIKIIQSAPPDKSATTSDLDLHYNTQFTSTDGSVTFHMSIDKQYQDSKMPVVEVSPHFFTGEDAKRVAHALFGESDFYEMEPLLAPAYSKADLRAVIERWTSYPDKTDAIKKTIQDFTIMMETAPEENPHTPCEWSFKKESFYIESPENAEMIDTSTENDTIQVAVKKGEIPYALSVTTRNRSDFKINNIFAYPYDVLGATSIDTPLFKAQMCRTEKPSAEELANVTEKASEILKQIALGDWEIDNCYIDVSGSEQDPEYVIRLSATPVFQGIAAFRRPQFDNLKSEELFASNYYLSDVQFEFSANGDLLSFSMYSPVDVKQVVNEDVQTLSFEELSKLAQNHFTLTDIYEYDSVSIVDHASEKITGVVTISDAIYGLTRVKVPNTDESYYYVPAISFLGAVELYGETSGDLYYESKEPEPLLVLNAVDGTIINLAN